jgi:hypothetical protein
MEEDKDDASASPARRLCDVCSQEATHTFAGCRGHTVVPLSNDNEGDEVGGERRRKEKWCSKHTDQRLSLRCTPCAQVICMQCKLTRHEGHDTEDLENAGAKVKDKVRALLEDMTLRMQRLEQLQAAMDDRRSKLQQQRQEMERQLQQRADTLTKWVSESLDEAVHNVKATSDQLEASLS